MMMMMMMPSVRVHVACCAAASARRLAVPRPVASRPVAAVCVGVAHAAVGRVVRPHVARRGGSGRREVARLRHPRVLAEAARVRRVQPAQPALGQRLVEMSRVLLPRPPQGKRNHRLYRPMIRVN
jgi:hypothetical protein